MLFSGSSCKFGVMATSHVSLVRLQQWEPLRDITIFPYWARWWTIIKPIDRYLWDGSKQTNSNCMNTAMVNPMHVDLPIPILQTHSVALAAFAARAFLALHTAGVSPKWGPPQSTTVTWCNLHHHGLSRLLPCAAHGACWTVPAPNLKGLKIRLDKSMVHRFDPAGLQCARAAPLLPTQRLEKQHRYGLGHLGWGPDGLVPEKTYALGHWPTKFSWVDDGRWCLEFLPGGSLFSDMLLDLLDSVDPCFDYIPIHSIIPVAWKAPWNGPKECGEQDKKKSQSKHSPLRIVTTWWMNSAG